MRTSSKQRIDELTTAGHWGHHTLHGLLEAHAANTPNKLALKDQPDRESLTGDAAKELNWEQTNRAAINLAISLKNAGIREDDKVIVQLPNIVELALVYFALSKLGAIVSPIPIQYGSHELQKIAKALDSKFLINIERFRDLDMVALAKSALPDITVLTLNQGIDLDASTVEKHEPDWPEDDANRVLTICWTSGTTGTPKGVPRSHNMWLATGVKSLAAGSYTENDILLNPFPLVNMAALGGFLFPTMILGCSLVLHHPINIPVYLNQLQTEKITFTIAPPALLNELAKSEEMWKQFDFSALRAVGSGSAPLSPWMIDTFDNDYGKSVINYYGSNEGIALYATPQSAPTPEMRAAVFGLPLKADGIATKVVNMETGEEVTVEGERGELLIAGATVFDGYLDHDNEGVFSADGFFHTGDLVEIVGSDGRNCRIVGRCKDIINRGGMKISPAELDVAIEQHPSLVEGAVCAYPDERLGEKICACVVMKPDMEHITLEALNEMLLEQGFAKFKLPERLEILERLPRNALAKVERFTLEDIVKKSIAKAV
jgi:acyl-CoA synthetase (AMP-forming)/AMP-acid ligase II